MKHAVLYRFQYSKHQTLGMLFGFDENNEDVFKCKTLELPWKHNQKNVSCIPGSGAKYLVKVFNSPTKGRCYKLEYVIDRTNIEIHIGNYNRDILGCILPGEEFMDIDGDGLKDVTNSGKTLNKMFEKMGYEFYLTIV